MNAGSSRREDLFSATSVIAQKLRSFRSDAQRVGRFPDFKYFIVPLVTDRLLGQCQLVGALGSSSGIPCARRRNPLAAPASPEDTFTWKYGTLRTTPA